MTLSVPSDTPLSPSPLRADAMFDVLLHRRSMGLSRLKPDPVDQRLIERMLEAANWAPSHGDTEPWRFTVFSYDNFLMEGAGGYQPVVCTWKYCQQVVYEPTKHKALLARCI